MKHSVNQLQTNGKKSSAIDGFDFKKNVSRMMKLKIALFMIFLIASLPVVSAIQLSKVSASGEEGVSNVIQEDDSVDFSILVDLDGQDLTPEDLSASDLVVIRANEEYQVETCNWFNGSFDLIECTKSLNIETSSASVYYFDVALGGSYFTPRPMLFLDTTGPSYYDTQISAVQSGSNINYVVSSRDKVNYGATKCAGLGEIDFFLKRNTDSGFTSSKLDSNTFSGGCFEELVGNVSIDSSLDETVSFCVEIYDVFGNKGNWSKCTTLDVDTNLPVVSEVKLLKENLDPLRALDNEEVFARISFSVFDENGVDKDKTSAYFNLDGSEEEVELTVSGVEPSLNGTQVNFVSLPFLLSDGSGSVLVGTKIKAYDTSGNLAEKQKGFDLKQDETGPTPLEFIGGYENLNVRVFNSKQEFNVTFNEPGVGMFDSLAYVNIVSSDFSQIVKSSGCVETSPATWSCSFRTPPLEEGNYDFFVHGSTADDFKNIASSSLSIPVVIDNTAPSIVKVGYLGKSSYGLIPNVVAENQVIVLNVTYLDDSPINFTVDFSYFRTVDDVDDPDYNIITKICYDSPCLIESKNIGKKRIASAYISAIDAVGNYVVPFEKEISVIGINENATPLSPSVDLSPATLDREVSQIVNQKLFASIDFLNNNSGISIIDVTYDNCISAENLTEDQGGMEYIGTTSYVGSTEDKKTHYIMFQTKTEDYFIDELKLNCLFTVTAYDSEYLYPYISEIVPIEIGFHNNPADMPDEALQKKIDDAVAETEGMWKTLDSIYEFVQMLEMICGIYSTIRGIIVSVATILGVLGITEMELDATVVGTGPARAVGITESLGCNANQAVAKGADTMAVGFLDQMCSFISCQISFFDYIDNPMGSKNSGETTDTSRGQTDTALKVTDESKNLLTKMDKSANALNFYSDNGGYNGETVIDANGLSLYSSDSIIMQFINLCLPGLLKKAHEWRGIKCEYVNCLIESQATGGLTESSCESIQANMECRFIFGELWSMLPFTAIIQEIMNLVKMILTDPIFATFYLADQLCTIACKSPAYAGIENNACGFVFKGLAFADAAMRLMKIAENFETMFNFETADSACETMETNIEQMEEETKSFEDKVRERTTDSSSRGSSRDQSGSSNYNTNGYGGTAAS